MPVLRRPSTCGSLLSVRERRRELGQVRLPRRHGRKIKNIDGFTDAEGVKTLTVTLGAVYDTAWSTGSKYLEARVTNQEATA